MAAGISGSRRRTSEQYFLPPQGQGSFTESAGTTLDTKVLIPVTTIARPMGDPGYSQTLPCTFESAEPARGLVRTALDAWALGSLVDDATLVVSELVGNAARHTRSQLVQVSVTQLTEDTVLVTVVDKDTAEIVRRDPGPDDVNGRGLMLVEALTECWGVTPHPWGKQVWAQLRTAGTETYPSNPVAAPGKRRIPRDPRGGRAVNAARTRTRPRILDHEPEAITWARKKAGLTKRALAREIGISEQLVGEIESGWRNATPANLAKIAGALNCPLVCLERKRPQAPEQPAHTTTKATST